MGSIDLVTSVYIGCQKPPLILVSERLDFVCRGVRSQTCRTIDIVGIGRTSTRVIRSDAEVFKVELGCHYGGRSLDGCVLGADRSFDLVSQQRKG